MSALIYVDLAHVRPIIDGVYHRAELARMPEPGQTIWMLCGASACVEYAPTQQRRVLGAPSDCQGCDRKYRLKHGIPPDQAPRRARADTVVVTPL